MDTTSRADLERSISEVKETSMPYDQARPISWIESAGNVPFRRAALCFIWRRFLADEFFLGSTSSHIINLLAVALSECTLTDYD